MLVGFGALLRLVGPRRLARSALLGVMAGCLLVTATTGVLLRTQGYGQHFRTHDPALFAALEGSLSRSRPR